MNESAPALPAPVASDIPDYKDPCRFIKMNDGKQWRFAFDNRCIHYMDKHYGGSPSGVMEILHCLTGFHQFKNGQVTLDEFIDLMPSLVNPAVKPIVDALMEEMNAAQKGLGNAPEATETQVPSAPEPGGNDATTTAE